ncbi:MAG: hypothetical protein HOV81_34300 [Kofleriaceae bacterium]|nr:hypothetical protein [Kofleriaceae bacterium]
MQYSVLGAALLVALLSTPASANTPGTDEAPVAKKSLTEMVLTPPPVVDVDVALPAPLPPPAPVEVRLDEIVRAGRSWRFETSRGPIHVWVPASYDPDTAATVVFVHGYHVDVDTAWNEYRLPQQFALSGINAMFIAPEAPAGKNAVIAWPSLRGLVASVAAQIDVRMPTKRLVVMGHSGAYRTLAVWLANDVLDTVILLDAVYGEYSFAPWARASKSRRLINIAYETGRYCDYLHRMLPGTVRIDGLPLGGFPEGRILYAKTDVGHWQLVTDGVAIPLTLRAIAVPLLPDAPSDIPLGLPQRCDPSKQLPTDAALAERDAKAAAAAEIARDDAATN